ncbi:MAG: gluconate 2-dehydrogenase subunit 3 family protein [Xanthomonadales bacterium]|nr:gluconate 2-dehydrogenase subunit 3 family protein [Xanthomonadales bacterium]
MIRRTKPGTPDTKATKLPLDAWRRGLTSRRRFLVAAAGGSVALLFAQKGVAIADSEEPGDPWPTLEATLEHMLPSEPESPGAAEIHAPDYLRFVVADSRIDLEERDFILQGSRWLDDLARERKAKPFVELGFDDKEKLLRQVTRSAAGENWVSTLLSYLLEALLTAPAYGGNTDGIGWRWLEYVPGFPLPGPGTRYPELPL